MTVSAYIDIPGGTDPGAPASGTGRLTVDSSGNLEQTLNGGSAVKLIGTGAAAATTPADPTGNATTTLTMMGLAGTFTPVRSGRMYLSISGNLTNSTATAGDGARAQLSYGTGSAPANAAALTGTQVGAIVTSVLERATASDLQGFSVQWVLTGLTIGTTYWYDLALSAVVGGTGQAKNLTMVDFELP
jgi:hypothetical protein